MGLVVAIVEYTALDNDSFISAEHTFQTLIGISMRLARSDTSTAARAVGAPPGPAGRRQASLLSQPFFSLTFKQGWSRSG